MATIKLILKRKLRNDEYGVYIRILHQDNPAKYLRIPFKSKLLEWNNEKQRYKKNKNGYKELNKSLNEIETRAENIISTLEINNSFSYTAFENSYHNKKEVKIDTIDSFFKAKLCQLEQTKRYGSYRTYNNCYSSLLKFTSLDFSFLMIDFKFLKDFEVYHIKLGNRPNSYGGYFRILRALHYEYCKLKDIPEPNIYKRFNIARIKNETRKKSLTIEQLRKLIDYKPNSKAQNEAKLIFLFSFYARGINLMDMLQLTYANLIDGVLVYERQKTGKQMRIKLVEDAIQILNYFSNETEYLFPYLRKGEIPKHRVGDVNSNINRRLKLIGKTFGLVDLTMYYARHTFAELNYKAGVRIEIISQMLGHSDLKTTQTYLRSFSDDEIDEAANQIINSL